MFGVSHISVKLVTCRLQSVDLRLSVVCAKQHLPHLLDNHVVVYGCLPVIHSFALPDEQEERGYAILFCIVYLHYTFSYLKNKYDKK